MNTKKLVFIILLGGMITVMRLPQKYLTFIKKIGDKNNVPRATINNAVKNTTTIKHRVSVKHPVKNPYDPRQASQERLERAALECTKHNIVYNNSHVDSLLVSHMYKVIIKLISKVGSRTWRRVMREIDPTSDDAENRRILSSLTSSEIDQYVRGVFFREPLERIVSYYHFVFSPDTPQSTSYFNQYYKYMRNGHVNATMNNKPYLTFSQFAQMIIDYDTKPARSWHWERQYLVSHVCSYNYTFVGHMDHLAQDAPYFVQLAVGDLFHYPEVQERTGSVRFKETMSTLPHKIIDQLINYYRLDYEILGFKIPALSKK
ncbi:carbohydrate sulfotransferase 9-like [Saccoglossus kowalevskii]|uniref:Carbohydrate sulfotransferase n=1 Tax=Saccoglossus kowalevskii TaxID=10224 RepID=A0ABM0MFK3_SACKO|nr:PREDICTED: carbohydrate sulfotransferase 9-like [Saccoglossus kowalevskii]